MDQPLLHSHQQQNQGPKRVLIYKPRASIRSTTIETRSPDYTDYSYSYPRKIRTNWSWIIEIFIFRTSRNCKMQLSWETNVKDAIARSSTSHEHKGC